MTWDHKVATMEADIEIALQACQSWLILGRIGISHPEHLVPLSDLDIQGNLNYGLCQGVVTEYMAIPLPFSLFDSGKKMSVLNSYGGHLILYKFICFPLAVNYCE